MQQQYTYWLLLITNRLSSPIYFFNNSKITIEKLFVLLQL